MKRLFLFISLIAVLAAGCKSTNFVEKSQKELDAMETESYRARDSFLAGNYAEAETILTELSRERTVSQPLYLCELATVQLAQNRQDEALNNYLKAQQDLELLFDKSKEAEAQSLWSGETNKVYKGDPHETTTLYMLIGTLMLNKGDSDTAIAAFKSALLRDGDVNDPTGVHSSDYALGQMLLGECYRRINDTESAKKLRNAALFSAYEINIRAPLVFKGQYDALFRFVALKRMTPRLQAMAQNELTGPEQKQKLTECVNNLQAMTFRQFLTGLQDELNKTQQAVLAIKLTADLQYQDAVMTETEIDRIAAAPKLAIDNSAMIKLRNHRLETILDSNRKRMDEIGQLLLRSDDELQNLFNSADEIDWVAQLDPICPYASLQQPYNTLLMVWHGQGPYFIRTGDYDEVRQLCPGERYADYLDIKIDGQTCQVIKGLGDLNYQASTRGERLMDEILRTKAQTKKITRIVAVGMFVTGVALLSTGNQYLMPVGGGLMAFGAIVYAITYLMEPTADRRCWKNLPAEFYLVPVTLPPGPHKADFKTYDGPFVTDQRSVDFELRPEAPQPDVRHLFAGNVGIAHNAAYLTQKQAERYYLMAFLAEEGVYVSTTQDDTVGYLAGKWDHTDAGIRDTVIINTINGQYNLFVEHQFVR